jgi:CO/xanthine dehydrogenase FAD-binding subunit
VLDLTALNRITQREVWSKSIVLEVIDKNGATRPPRSEFQVLRAGTAAAVQIEVIAIQIANILHSNGARNLTPGTQSLSIMALYIKPKSLPEAVAALASGEARILAGGTDFYPALGDRVVKDTVLDVSGLGELRGVSRHTDHFRIGGLTTWSDIIATPLPRCFDALKGAAREVGSVQIQNRGTVAGNLCNASPAADGVPPLLTLDAEVELVSTAGMRRMPLTDFIVGNRKTLRKPDELLTAVLIPRVIEDAASTFLKLGARRYLVISISMVAVVVLVGGDGRMLEARVAVGSCSAVARRLPALETDLAGASVTNGLGQIVKPEHLAPLSPIDDGRATAEYRMDTSLRLVQRALNSCVGNN